jgi:hypothetical protein
MRKWSQPVLRSLLGTYVRKLTNASEGRDQDNILNCLAYFAAVIPPNSESHVLLISRTSFRTFAIVPTNKIQNISEEASSFLRYTDKNPKIHKLALDFYLFSC